MFEAICQLRANSSTIYDAHDETVSAPAIAEALRKLEEQAIANGSAIATGSGLAVTIDTVAEWAKSLADKGILLVPVSAAYRARTS